MVSLYSFPNSICTHSPSLPSLPPLPPSLPSLPPSPPPLSLPVLLNIVTLYLFRSGIKDKDAGESRSLIEEWEEPADGAGFWAEGVLEF